MTVFRSLLACSLLSISSSLVISNPAQAGEIEMPPDFQSDYEAGWGEWRPAVAANTEVRTASIRAFSECLVPDDPIEAPGTGAVGDEFDFTFGLFGDNCYSGNAIDRRPVAVFYWQNFDAEGEPVNFPCLDVRGSVSSEWNPQARIVFEPGVTFGVASANVTQSRFTDVTELEFALEIPYLEDESIATQGVIGADDFLISISIDECGGGDGPDIDIEHYRRMAEQATSLPDTL